VAERLRLELGGALAVEWDLDALMRAADSADPAAPPAWELIGLPDWEQTASLRLIVGAAGDQGLAVAVARPAGARDHSADEVTVALIGPEGSDTAEDVLLSTEYDPAGRMRRLGVELWLEGGAGKRIAADRSADPTGADGDGLRREATPLAVRFDGESGTGLHDLLLPP
jgi:hypothetical protein